MSRNTQEGKFAGKFQKHPWHVNVVRQCRTGPKETSWTYSLKEYVDMTKKAREQ